MRQWWLTDVYLEKVELSYRQWCSQTAPRLEMIIFYNFTRVVGSQALSYHTSNWETARPPQTLVSCEREKNSTISQLVLAKIWLICNTKCWQYKNNKALPVLSQPITNGTNTFLQRKHQLNTPLLFQTLFYCCFSGWRDMFCPTSSHPSLVFCVNPPLLEELDSGSLLKSSLDNIIITSTLTLSEWARFLDWTFLIKFEFT